MRSRLKFETLIRNKSFFKQSKSDLDTIFKLYCNSPLDKILKNKIKRFFIKMVMDSKKRILSKYFFRGSKRFRD